MVCPFLVSFLKMTLPFVSSTDWVDVANDLLRQCHLSLRLRDMTDCNADVFVSLYENILGEKVPGKKKKLNASKSELFCGVCVFP